MDAAAEPVRRVVSRQSASPLWVVAVGLVAALAIAFAISVPTRFVQLTVDCSEAFCRSGQLTPTDADVLRSLGISVAAYAAYLTALETIVALSFIAVAAAILWCRAGDHLASFAALVLTNLGVTVFGTVLAHPDLSRVMPFALASTQVGVLLFLAVFPDGRFAPRWIVPVVALWSAWRISRVVLPPGELRDLVMLSSYSIFLELAFFCLGAVAQVSRYRGVSDPVQRQQTKWVVYGCTLAVVGLIVYYLPPAVLPSLREGGLPRVGYLLVASTAYSGAILLVPATIAISILRHRLWDVDLIVNRTLVYGSMTVGLGATYFALVVGLQRAFVVLTGEVSDLSIVASTAVIAALFAPLRGMLQTAVDRRFYRQRYDAARVLAEVSASVRDEVQIDRLTERMLAAVAEALQPAHAQILFVEQSATASRAEESSQQRISRPSASG